MENEKLDNAYLAFVDQVNELTDRLVDTINEAGSHPSVRFAALVNTLSIGIVQETKGDVDEETKFMGAIIMDLVQRTRDRVVESAEQEKENDV